jgi:aryl-alcohol dehydrogenase-like predicted oxidoreductase
MSAAAVPRVPLGSQGLVVPRLGYGSMGITWVYSPNKEKCEQQAEAIYDEVRQRRQRKA